MVLALARLRGTEMRLLTLPKRSAQLLETWLHAFRRASHADANALRIFEEMAGHDTDFVLGTQTLAQFGGCGALDARENHGPVIRPEVVQRRLGLQDLPHQSPIFIEAFLLHRSDLRKLLERNHTEQLSRVNIRAHVQILQVPN